MSLRTSVLLAGFLLAAVWPAFGQADRGTITGIVTDQAGAVVAGAAVQAKNSESGQVYQSVTTETGNYTIVQLPYGTYEVVVEVSGFKKYSHSNLLVQVAQTIREDIQMQVGAATDSVTVTAEASLLKTESGELSHEITVTQMQELPILAVGGGGGSATSGFRNPWSVALMIPGTQFISNSSMYVNGSTTTSYSIRIEGMDAQMDGANIIYTQRVQPSVDAIQEVAIQTSNFAAEFGQVGGGLFNTTMKSGSNAYHGSGYDYIVNEALNAHQPYTFQRSQARRQDLGGTMGGPVRIPKIYNGKDRTFFFWSYEEFVENLTWTQPPAMIGGGVGTYPTVPSADFRRGDFSQVILGSGINGVPRNLEVSAGKAYVDPLGRTVQSGTIFDPNTERPVTCPATGANCTPGTTVLVRDPFQGNLVPSARFDKVAAAIQDKYIPLPTISNQLGQNYANPWKSERTSALPSLKIDHQISAKGHLSGYFQLTGTDSQYSSPNGNMEGFPTPITVARGTFIHTKIIRINYDHSLTPTLLGHLGVGYFQQNFDDHSPVTDFNGSKELGLLGATVNRTFPQIEMQAATLATGGMSNMGPGAQGPSKEIKPQANASMTWVRRNHTFKSGAEWRATGYPTYNFTNTSGTYTFASSATGQTALQNQAISQGTVGFGYASFLLGYLTNTNGATILPATTGLAAPVAAKTGQQELSMFLQDTWKITRKLTLDYGIRWDYGTYSREEHGRYGSFDPSLPDPAAGGHLGATAYEAVCHCTFAPAYPYAIGPRIGVAYQFAPKTVFRGGFGIVYTPIGVVSGASTNSAAFNNVAFDQFLPVSFANAMTTLHPVWPGFDPSNNAAAGTVVGAPTFIDHNAGRPSRISQWSLGIQREISRNLVVEASYVANRAVWISGNTAGNLAPLNVISPQLLARYGFTDFNSASDAALLNATISSLTPAQRVVLDARGVNLSPYAGFPTNQTVRQALLPFPQFTLGTGATAGTGISPSGAPLGKSWFDSLQATATKRFSSGLSLNANFTWSKTLTLLSSPDVFNRQLGKTLANTTGSVADLPFQFRISADYVVPKAQFIRSRPLSYALRDWGIGWYASYQSAALLVRPSSTGGATSIDKFFGRGPGPAQYIPGQPLYSVDWTDLSGKHHTDELDINCHCYDPTKTVVLNPKAWSNIPDGQWGAQQGALEGFRGIRYPQENANVSRTFAFKEKYRLQVRAEFQNIFNRTQLPQPSVTGNFAAVPTAANGLYTGGFGTVVPTGGTGNFRTGLLIARFQF